MGNVVLLDPVLDTTAVKALIADPRLAATIREITMVTGSSANSVVTELLSQALTRDCMITGPKHRIKISGGATLEEIAALRNAEPVKEAAPGVEKIESLIESQTAAPEPAPKKEEPKAEKPAAEIKPVVKPLRSGDKKGSGQQRRHFK